MAAASFFSFLPFNTPLVSSTSACDVSMQLFISFAIRFTAVPGRQLPSCSSSPSLSCSSSPLPYQRTASPSPVLPLLQLTPAGSGRGRDSRHADSSLLRAFAAAWVTAGGASSLSSRHSAMGRGGSSSAAAAHWRYAAARSAGCPDMSYCWCRRIMAC